MLSSEQAGVTPEVHSCGNHWDSAFRLCNNSLYIRELSDKQRLRNPRLQRCSANIFFRLKPSTSSSYWILFASKASNLRLETSPWVIPNSNSMTSPGLGCCHTLHFRGDAVLLKMALHTFFLRTSTHLHFEIFFFFLQWSCPWARHSVHHCLEGQDSPGNVPNGNIYNRINTTQLKSRLKTIPEKRCFFSKDECWVYIIIPQWPLLKHSLYCCLIFLSKCCWIVW